MGYDASLRASKHANAELANDLEHTKVGQEFAQPPRAPHVRTELGSGIALARPPANRSVVRRSPRALPRLMAALRTHGPIRLLATDYRAHRNGRIG